MKTIKLSLASFIVCMILGAGIVLLAPPTAQSDPPQCTNRCGHMDYCPLGPPGSCTSPDRPVTRCWIDAMLAGDCVDLMDQFNCGCTFIGCVSFCP